VQRRRQEIAEFSDLGEFLHLPVRCYSSGMMVRLAFSIATAIEPEVLLIDETLSAGDVAFQEKAQERMRELVSRAQVLVMVSHDLPSVLRLCRTVLWLDHGRVHRLGPAREVIEEYRAAHPRPRARRPETAAHQDVDHVRSTTAL
jgi:ABC-type polysaccharide/polyol phosphate transport system ATPase subunit